MLKKTTSLFHLFTICMLLMMSASSFVQPVMAQKLADPSAPDVTPTTLPKPIVVFEGTQRNDNPPGDTDVFPTTGQDLNDPMVLGAVPDTSGAAGHTHFLQAVNKMVALFTKDGTLIERTTFAAFWANSTGTTACSTEGGANHHGQPYVIYDHLARRFVVLDVAYDDIDLGPYFFCIAVSNTNTPPFTPGAYFNATNWYFYALQTNAGSGPQLYPDMPKLALWPDGYYISADMYQMQNHGFYRTPQGVRVFALNRTDLVDNVANFRFVSHYLAQDMTNYQHLVPTNLEGNPPAFGMPNYFASIAPGKFYIWKYFVDWQNPSKSLFGNALSPNWTLNTDTSNDNWANGYIIPQPLTGTNVLLDAHGNRLMSPMQYRIVDGIASLWANHTILANNISSQRFYEIQFAGGVPNFYQTGTYAPDAFSDFPKYRWMGSLAVDRAGNMALGYNESSEDAPASPPGLVAVPPAVFYTARLRNDPLGKLTRGERLLQKGAIPTYNGVQFNAVGNDNGPWGRQSQMSIDPLDECVFWYTNMFYSSSYTGTFTGGNAGNNWHTVIGWFTLPECRGGMTTRVSLGSDANYTFNNIQGNDNSGLPLEEYSAAISGNGRYVVFSSVAGNLVAGLTKNCTDGSGNPRYCREVFLRDRDYDGNGIYDEPGGVRTILLSRGMNGKQANGDAWEVAMSTNGRFIAFNSDATNLVSADNNGARDVFVYDRDFDNDGDFDDVTSITRASVKNNTANDDGHGGECLHPSISGDGRYIAFSSTFNDLVTGDTNNKADVFVRDRQLNRTTRISLGIVAGPPVTRTQLTEDSTNPWITQDGRFVTFVSKDPTLAGSATPVVADANGNLEDIFIADWRTTPFTLTVASVIPGLVTTGNNASFTPFISTDGNYVTFASRASDLVANDTNNLQDIFVYDRSVAPAVVTRVNVNFFGQQAVGGNSYLPSITTDGRFLTFSSDATNLDSFLPDFNAARDIFIHDRETDFPGAFPMGLTTRISLDINRTDSNNSSYAPIIASLGRHVAFVSAASDLVTNDTNNRLDVFAFDKDRALPVFLKVPGGVPGTPGQIVAVPVNFTPNDMQIDSLAFSIDFDETCLQFDQTVPGAITFSSLLGSFTKAWSFNPADTTGELDFSIYDQVSPREALPKTSLVTIKFKVKSTCAAPPDSTNSARVGFSLNPPPSFGSNDLSVKGISIDGFVSIQAGVLGDCNGDGTVNAADLSAIVLEIFDGDGQDPLLTPGGTFPGNAVGCNPNQDNVVDAADISCDVSIIWNGASAGCTGSLKPLQTGANQPVSLNLPVNYPAQFGKHVTLPISLDTQGKQVNSTVFSVDFDQTWLSFDNSDANGDGVPDSLTWNLPVGYKGYVFFDPARTNGELNFAVFNAASSAAVLPDGTLLNLKLNVKNGTGSFLAQVKSSSDPLASFGGTNGESLAGVFNGGSVNIVEYLMNVFLPTLRK